MQADEKALAVFKNHGGMMRMAEAVRAGIHRRTLYALRDAGAIEPISRGLFRIADGPPLREPDLIAVARRVPKGVICLVSALAFHDLTTQIPHEVYLAVPRDSELPRIDYPPVRAFRFSPKSFEAGIETRVLDGVSIRVYSREKTIADCFKYRSKVGLDNALEALVRYKEQGRVNGEALFRFAEVCRVAKVIRPYLEAIL